MLNQINTTETVFGGKKYVGPGLAVQKAMDAAGINLFRYYPKEKLLIFSELCAEKFGFGTVYSDIFHNFCCHFVALEDRESFLSLFSDIDAGSEKASGTVTFAGSSNVCRVVLSPIVWDKDGTAEIVVGVIENLYEDDSKRKKAYIDLKKTNRTLKRTLISEQEKNMVIESLGNIYIAVYHVNFLSGSVSKVFSRFKEEVMNGTFASEAIVKFCEKMVAPEYRERMRAFLDINEIKNRLKSCNFLAEEYISINFGWCRVSCIASARDSEGRVTDVLAAFQIINEEKKEINRADRVIKALSCEYQNLVFSDESGRIIFYRLSSEIHENYKDELSSHNYEDALNFYRNNVVAPECRHLFDEIDTLEKLINKLEGNNNNFSFVYHVMRGGVKKYFMCNVVRMNANTCEAAFGFKDVTSSIENEVSKQFFIQKKIDVIQSMSEIYFAVYYLNLREEILEEIKSTNDARKIVDSAIAEKKNFKYITKLFCDNFIASEYRKGMEEFLDFSTVEKRIEGRKVISFEYFGTIKGWCRASLIPARYDSGSLSCVIFTVEQINDEKKARDEHLGIIEVLSGSYESVYAIDVNRGMACPYRISKKNEKVLRLNQEFDWNNFIEYQCDNFIDANYKKEFAEAISIRSLLNAVEEKGAASYEYAVCVGDTEKIYQFKAFPMFNKFGLKQIVIGFSDVDELRRKEIMERNAMQERMDIILSMSGIYYAAYYVDLRNDSFVELNSKFAIHSCIGTQGNVTEKLQYVCDHLIEPQFREEHERFTDLTTLNDRLRGKKFITFRYIGRISGWSEALFIAGSRDGDGNLTHVFYAVREINEEKQKEIRHEKELCEARERAESLAERRRVAYNLIHETLNSGMWLIIFNKKGHVSDVIWSEEYRRILGYSNEEDFPNAFSSWINVIHKEDREFVLSQFDDVVKDYSGVKKYNAEYRAYTKDGELRWFRTAGRMARNSSGTPIYFSGIFIDITDDKQKELLLKNALKQAELASEAKSSFLSSMSHDIRTPMNGIIGMTAIAAAHADEPEKVLNCLEKITSASKHLLGLVNEVLDMSKIESGKINLQQDEFILSELIDNLLMMTKAQLNSHNHALSVNILNVEHEKVIGDSLRIQQAFVNLMSNAIKYTPDGGRIALTVSEKKSNDDKVGCYEFIFEDNGYGMTPEFLKKIFDPFERADDARLKNIPGTGLGMSITKNILHLMGGDIKAESELGKGSKFTVTLFLQLQNVKNIDYKKFTDLPVLIADDDVPSCESAVQMLCDLGMRAEGVLSGYEAYEKTLAAHKEGNDYFAVILDWKMPDMDGLAAAKAIRESIGKDVPIIILSAYDWSVIEAEAREAGITAFISKPLFKSRLERLFCSLVGEDKASSVSESADNVKTSIDELDLTGKRVLLAEDNELNAEIASEILSMTGCTAERACNGYEAVRMFSEAPDDYYSLIFMDIQMPKMNGYEAAAAIRSCGSERARTIPIIAMSANAFAEDVVLAKASGMNDHLAKPIDVNLLAAVLDKWIK